MRDFPRKSLTRSWNSMNENEENTETFITKHFFSLYLEFWLNEFELKFVFVLVYSRILISLIYTVYKTITNVKMKIYEKRKIKCIFLNYAYGT